MAKFSVPPPGHLVDIGGRRLHVRMMGEGSPAVVLEAGLVTSSQQWARVMPAVARVTRVVAYDRAGLGWSDPGPAPRTAGAAVADLRRLLEALSVPGPYVLAAHSYGGLVARLYAAMAGPAQVPGLVLFDSTHPDQFARLRVDVAAQTRILRATPALARTGLLWLSSFVPGFPMLSAVRDLPDGPRALARLQLRSPRNWETAVAEWEAQPESFRQVRALPLSKALHLTVVSAGKAVRRSFAGLTPAEYLGDHHRLQADLAARIPGAQHLIHERADHMRVAGLSEATAPLAIRVIRDMVEQVRAGE